MGPYESPTGRHQWICNTGTRATIVRVWASDSFDLYIPPCLAGMKGERRGGRARGAGVTAAWRGTATSERGREGGRERNFKSCLAFLSGAPRQKPPRIVIPSVRLSSSSGWLRWPACSYILQCLMELKILNARLT